MWLPRFYLSWRWERDKRNALLRKLKRKDDEFARWREEVLFDKRAYLKKIKEEEETCTKE